MPARALPSPLIRGYRTAVVTATAATVYLGYKRTQRRVEHLPAGQRDAAWAAQHLRSAERIAATARRLRGLFVKSAQFLGARADLLPEQYITVLSQLHDRVPPQQYAVMRAVLREALGAEPELVFAEFDRTPVAAASLAQVHRARLRDGREVAVKVQYPDIERLVRLDMRNLKTILGLVHRAERSLDLRPLAEAVARLVPQELDFVNEARGGETISTALAHRGDVLVPAVVWEYSSTRVLVTEYVEGVKVSEVETLRAAGHDPAAIAARVVDIWGEQVLGLGHFHGDPHPGNVLVLADGRVALLDFGLTARFTPQTRDGVARLCRASARFDPAGVMEAFRSLGFETPADGPAPYLRLGGNYMGTTEEIESINTRVSQRLRGFNLERAPAEALLMMRVLGLLSGLSARLGRPGPVMPAWLPYADAAASAAVS